MKGNRGAQAIVLFGVLSLAYGLLSGFGVWKAAHAEDPGKYKEVVETLAWSCGVSLVFGLVLILAGWWLGRFLDD